MLKTRYKYRQDLFKEKETFGKFAAYLCKRADSISDMSEIWGKRTTEYKVDLNKEYSKFLKKAKIKPDQEYDQKILNKINVKLDKNFKYNSKSRDTMSALFEAVLKCYNENLMKIDDEIMNNSL